jgi:hypothetical protein
MDNLNRNLKNFIEYLTINNIESFEDIRFQISANQGFSGVYLDAKYIGFVSSATQFTNYLVSFVRQNKLGQLNFDSNII